MGENKQSLINSFDQKLHQTSFFIQQTEQILGTFFLNIIADLCMYKMNTLLVIFGIFKRFLTNIVWFIFIEVVCDIYS